MVSRWNYIAITAVMAVVFFLFQFTNVMLESWNNYEENSYIRNTEELPTAGDAYAVESGADTEDEKDVIVYIGSEEDAAREVVRAWTAYTKKSFLTYGTVEEYDTAGWGEQAVLPQMMVINGETLSGDRETERLESYAAAGVSLVFSGLPLTPVLEQDTPLQQLLGIQDIREEQTSVNGIHLYDGFLLGGEVTYYTEDEEEYTRRQDMELEFPWYMLSKETEVYMKGTFSGAADGKEDAPPVIWRNVHEGTNVFAVNGSYLEDAAGLGLLSAMSAKTKLYDLYPVVNAQNLVAVNYPGLSEENETEVTGRYGQSSAKLFRDTVWPALIAVYRQNTMGLTCMLAPQLDYEDESWPDAEQLVYYMKRLKEERAEMGLSGCCVSDTSPERKIQNDQNFMEGVLPKYRFTSFYAGDLTETEAEAALQEDFLSDVRTVAEAYDGTGEIVGYLTEEVTKQSILTDGVRHTYYEDFRSRSIETALGYTSVMVDLSSIVYPSGESDSLTDLTSFLGWNMEHYFKGFRGFDGTTLSESDERIRRFLALDYAQYREGNSIHLKLEQMSAPVWFVLRCRGEAPDRMEGGNFQKLEKGVYLVEVREADAVLTLKAGRD